MKCGGGLGIALGMLSSTVAAMPRAVVTTEAGVNRCLTSAELTARVESAFSGSQAPPDDQTLRVSISRAENGGLIADARWTSATQETPRRALESASDDCRQLDDAIPLVARALWEAAVTTPEAPPAAAPPDLPAPAPVPPTVGSESPALDVKPSRDRVLRAPTPSKALQVAFGAVGALGMLDETALGVRAEARVPLSGAWALRVAATRLSDGRVARVDGGSARFSAITGRAAGCWVLPSALRIDTCVGAEAGALLPQLSEVARADEAARPLLWPIALVAGRFALVGPLLAQASVAAGPALFRQDFYLIDERGDRQAVLRGAPALVEASLSLGVELR